MNTLIRRLLIALALLVAVYLAAGLAFHVKWSREQTACRELRMARGEFVEPEVFGGVIGLIFNATNWPLYAWANTYHFGDPFATPCTRP